MGLGADYIADHVFEILQAEEEFEISIPKQKLYIIELEGCDDKTRFSHWLYDEELELLKLLSIKSHQSSSYDCQPIIDIYRVDDGAAISYFSKLDTTKDFEQWLAEDFTAIHFQTDLSAEWIRQANLTKF